MSEPIAQVGGPKNRTTSGAITPGPCQLLGFYVHTTSSGVIQILDGGASGTALGGNITPAVGWHPYPFNIGSSAYLTVVSGSINVTFSFATGN